MPTTAAPGNDSPRLTRAEANALLGSIRRASQALARDRRTEALLAYQDVCDRAGVEAEIQFELGNLCQEMGDPHKAIAHYRIAAEQQADNALYLTRLGLAYLNDGGHEEARTHFEQAIEIAPDLAEAQHGLGVYYTQRADYETAVGHLERACALKPSSFDIRKNLSHALAESNRHDEALAHARKAARLNGADPGAMFLLAEILAQVGQLEEARKLLEQTIRRHKTFGFAYDLLAHLRRFSADDEPFIRQAEQMLDKGMSPAERSCLRFALGKMHDDCGHYDEAFAHYEQANIQQKRPYDSGDDETWLKQMKSLFTAESIGAFAAAGNSTAQPVFIVGMPRSGTTLMERIIASHPDAAGAGELPEMPRLAGIIVSRDGGRAAIARARTELTAAAIAAHADSYLSVLRQGRGDALRIVDKMPGNFLFLGLIKSLFPNASIINAVRHPLDSCLSCYFQNFTKLRWTNELESIGRSYSIYRRAMDYWRDVLPDGAIVDIAYEDLVEDPASQSRRLIEAAGLPWDPAVLEFAQAEGVVKTASIAQARRGIYQSSRGRWMSYAKHIQPLANTIAPYLEDDRELLRQHGIELPSAFGWLRRILD